MAGWGSISLFCLPRPGSLNYKLTVGRARAAGSTTASSASCPCWRTSQCSRRALQLAHVLTATANGVYATAACHGDAVPGAQPPQQLLQQVHTPNVQIAEVERARGGATGNRQSISSDESDWIVRQVPQHPTSQQATAMPAPQAQATARGVADPAGIAPSAPLNHKLQTSTSVRIAIMFSLLYSTRMDGYMLSVGTCMESQRPRRPQYTRGAGQDTTIPEAEMSSPTLSLRTSAT